MHRTSAATCTAHIGMNDTDDTSMSITPTNMPDRLTDAYLSFIHKTGGSLPSFTELIHFTVWIRTVAKAPKHRTFDFKMELTPLPNINT